MPWKKKLFKATIKVLLREALNLQLLCLCSQVENRRRVKHCNCARNNIMGNVNIFSCVTLYGCSFQQAFLFDKIHRWSFRLNVNSRCASAPAAEAGWCFFFSPRPPVRVSHSRERDVLAVFEGIWHKDSLWLKDEIINFFCLFLSTKVNKCVCVLLKN